MSAETPAWPDVYDPDAAQLADFGPDGEPLAGTLYTPPTVDPTTEDLDPPTQLILAVLHHVVIPAAMITMVAALLFYLVDLRSVFLPYGGALKWLGFFFVTATVLIARYGKMSGDQERQGCYKAALVAATILVILISPWERGVDNPLGRLASGLILLATWFYATRVTRSLAREGRQRPERGKLKLYGLERLRYEAWQKQQGKAVESAHVRAGDVHGHPNRAVARLSLGVLLLFAFSEPLILMGPPEIGASALAAVILFLIGTAVVLAAGSSVDQLQVTHDQGGRGSEGLVTLRVMFAGGLALVALAVALNLPGVHFEGTGELRPQAIAGEGQGGLTPAEEGEESEDGGRDPTGEAEASQERNSEAGESESGEENPSEEQSASLQMVGNLSSLGALLKWPVILLALLAGLYMLWRLLPLLGGLRGMLGNLHGLLARLLAGFSRGKKGRTKRRPRGDPWAESGTLQNLEPRDMILAAYRTLMYACEDVGRPRDAEVTPYEFVGRLVGPWQSLRDPATRLTDLYVRAAYSEEEISPQEGLQALAQLDNIRSIWKSLNKEPNAIQT